MGTLQRVVYHEAGAVCRTKLGVPRLGQSSGRGAPQLCISQKLPVMLGPLLTKLFIPLAPTALEFAQQVLGSPLEERVKQGIQWG